jgi:hypothetical protein
LVVFLLADFRVNINRKSTNEQFWNQDNQAPADGVARESCSDAATPVSNLAQFRSSEFSSVLETYEMQKQN